MKLIKAVLMDFRLHVWSCELGPLIYNAQEQIHLQKVIAADAES